MWAGSLFTAWPLRPEAEPGLFHCSWEGVGVIKVPFWLRMAENHCDKAMVIGFCGDSISEQENFANQWMLRTTKCVSFLFLPFKKHVVSCRMRYSAPRLYRRLWFKGIWYTLISLRVGDSLFFFGFEGIYSIRRIILIYLHTYSHIIHICVFIDIHRLNCTGNIADTVKCSP